MSKIVKMRDSRDKIIDQLIDDKNRIYTRLKREQRENAVLRSQLNRTKKEGSRNSESVRQ